MCFFSNSPTIASGIVPIASSHGNRPSGVPGARNIAIATVDEVAPEVHDDRGERAELDDRGERRPRIGLVAAALARSVGARSTTPE